MSRRWGLETGRAEEAGGFTRFRGFSTGHPVNMCCPWGHTVSHTASLEMGEGCVASGSPGLPLKLGLNCRHPPGLFFLHAWAPFCALGAPEPLHICKCPHYIYGGGWVS